jgi:DNA polymerase-3 subunit delta
MIIFLFGQDDYRLKEKLKALIQKFKEKRDKGGLSIVKLDGENLTIDEFRKSVFSPALFSEKRLIIIKNLMAKNRNEKLFEEIANYIKKEEKRENVVIFYETEKPLNEKYHQKFLNLLKKQKYVFEFEPLEKNSLRKWILNEVRKMSGQISKEAVDYLVNFFNGNLWEIKNELEKAFAYGNKKISLENLQILSEKRKEEKIFALIDALINKDKKRAVILLKEELEKGTPFSQILSMLAHQFRIILQIKGKKISNIYQLAESLGIHSFPLKKAIEQAKKYNLEELKKIYRELLKIDYQLKTLGIKPEILFDLLIARL